MNFLTEKKIQKIHQKIAKFSLWVWNLQNINLECTNTLEAVKLNLEFFKTFSWFFFNLKFKKKIIKNK